MLACGFIVRATDTATYYYVHFDRTQAILVRSDPDNSWNELQRVGDLKKPAGQWHEGRLECIGNTLKVYLNGTLLYEHHDQQLAGGRIGFYANQGRAHVKDIVVHGQARSPRGPLHTPPRSFVYVCEDGGAGGYEAFPDVCRLQDGRLMAVFYAGYTHVSLPCERLPRGGRIDYCMSDDEGRTWSRPKTLYDGPHDDRDPSIVQLKSGRLVCNFFSLAKSEDSRQNWVGQGTWMVTSDDLGRNWSQPRQITADAYCSAPIRELSDGRLILGLYRETNGSAHGAVTYSDDGGETWSEVIDIDNGGYKLDAETDIIELSMAGSMPPNARRYATPFRATAAGHGAFQNRSALKDIVRISCVLTTTSFCWPTDCRRPACITASMRERPGARMCWSTTSLVPTLRWSI